MGTAEPPFPLGLRSALTAAPAPLNCIHTHAIVGKHIREQGAQITEVSTKLHGVFLLGPGKSIQYLIGALVRSDIDGGGVGPRESRNGDRRVGIAGRHRSRQVSQAEFVGSTLRREASAKPAVNGAESAAQFIDERRRDDPVIGSGESFVDLGPGCASREGKVGRGADHAAVLVGVPRIHQMLRA